MVEWDRNGSKLSMEESEYENVTLTMDDYLYEFYRGVGLQAGIAAEQVMSDTLFKLAGELALNALDKKKAEPPR